MNQTDLLYETIRDSKFICYIKLYMIQYDLLYETLHDSN